MCIINCKNDWFKEVFSDKISHFRPCNWPAQKNIFQKKPGDLLYTTHNHEKRSLFMLIQRQSTIKKRYGDYKKQNY